jgi:hypothetical protein
LSSIAVLIGNAAYTHQSRLDCCERDVEAMRALLQATERFERIETYVNLDADAMRDAVRGALPVDGSCDELFFYFSGHGASSATDFFLCGTEYEVRSPNLTGVSHAELYDLFRATKPDTLITVIDSCFSGTLLVKRDRTPPPPTAKDGLRNVLQFSSSMDSQTSMGGDPLSEFTRAFLDASIRKTEGTVFYTDIANALRDVFIDNDDQTPHFVNQGTGRETLVDDAAKLAGFRDQLADLFRATGVGDPVDGEGEEGEPGDDVGRQVLALAPRTPKELLAAAEARMGSPEQATKLIGELFDGLIEKFDETEFAEFFDIDVTFHSRYEEPTIRNFMIRVLAKEQRPDRLVTAEIKRVKRKPNAFEAAASGLMYAMSQFNDDFIDSYDLQLNCVLDRAQLRLTLTPKFRSLQRLILVLSCAPSLERLYVFEVLTRHVRTDWNRFDSYGDEVVRRWYKLDWGQNPEGVIEKIRDALAQTVQDHIEKSVGDLELE